MNIDIMCDLETLDSKVGAVITQIGAANFDRKTGEIKDTFSINIDPQSAVRRGLTMSADTVMWWLKQSKQAQESLFENPQPIGEALLSFINWIVRQRQSIKDDRYRIWCHATFDFPILNHALEACDLPKPWGYKDARDIRTVVDLAGIDLDKYRMGDGEAYNALKDALNQVKYTVVAINILSPNL